MEFFAGIEVCCRALTRALTLFICYGGQVAAMRHKDPDSLFLLQLIPKVNSVPEDGRLYDLVVKSTIPFPCVNKSLSLEDCTITLELSTTSQGNYRLMQPTVLHLEMEKCIWALLVLMQRTILGEQM